MKPPKYHPELLLGKEHERGTPETFVAALKNAGFCFEETIKLDKKWLDRLKAAN